jgi:hypothetical protein
MIKDTGVVFFHQTLQAGIRFPDAAGRFAFLV